MRFLIASGRLLERGNPFVVPPGLDYEAVILAGDIHSPGRRGVAWAQQCETFGGRPVVLVPGKHEFYRTPLEEEPAAMRETAAGSAIHVVFESIAGVTTPSVIHEITAWLKRQRPEAPDDPAV